MANSIGNIEFEAIEQGTKLWPKSETEILLEQGKPFLINAMIITKK
jgi:hypothetical protein